VARGGLQRGVDKLANAVRVTMGPRGKTVILQKGAPVFTMDGVTVARDIELKDPVENIGAYLVREVAWKTDREAGDGTTAATLLSQVILSEGLKGIAAKLDRIRMREGIQNATAIVVNRLKEISRPISGIKDIANVATISSRDPEIGRIIAEIMKQVGHDAVISVEESHVMGLFKEIVKGMQLDTGMISPYFTTNREMGTATLSNPHILVTSQNIADMEEIVRLLEHKYTSENKDILLIVDDLRGEALQGALLNNFQKKVNIVAIKAPAFGDDKLATLEDIAVMTGATMIGEETGTRCLDQSDASNLGKARKVVVGLHDTIIVDGGGKKKDINKRISQLELQKKNEHSEYKKENLELRLAKLRGGIAVIRVGTPSEQESTEKRYRLEDAVRSTRSAIEEGVVPGGGVALLLCAQELQVAIEQENDLATRMGMEIIHTAIQEPARQIIGNTGENADVRINKIQEGLDRNPNRGWDAANGRR